MHELATNAVKYGALSQDEGRITVQWRVLESAGTRRLELEWRESGGPPVTAPSHRGFGSRLIERSLSRELHGDVKLDFEPAGLVCHIIAPLTE
jgi:two-component sensor histidine kinase